MARPTKGKSRITDLKRRIDIEDLIVHLGGDNVGSSSGWRPIRCCFHDDKSASASINTLIGRFNCHGCGIGGDIIDIAMHHLGTMQAKVALDWLEDELG